MAEITVPDFMLGAAPAQLPLHPLPAPDADTGARWRATWFRRKLMTGLWYQELYLWAQQERDPALLRAMGNLDVSESLYHSVVDQLGVVYEADPTIRSTAGNIDTDELSELFGSHALLNRSVLAYGEAAIVLEHAGSEVCSVLALPDEIAATPLHYGSRYLGTLQRATCRVLPNQTQESPCWDCWDVRDPKKPRYELRNMSGVAVKTEEGEAYCWRYEDGTPYIPAVLYHAEVGHQLWTPWRWPELARATLENAMNWSDWREALRNASFLLRYTMDAELDRGVDNGEGEEASTQHVIDPKVMLQLRSRGSREGSAGVLAAPVDVLAQAQAIVLRQKIRATHIGLYPSEIEIGGGPESGTALTIRREGQRREQRRQLPLFRRGDLELLRKWAACCRLADTSRPAIPETGWSITYPSLPLTESEARSVREAEDHDLEKGLTSRTRILAKRENLSLEDAALQIAAIRAEVGQEAGASPSFNGAQVSAALDVVKAVAASEIPRESGLGMLVKFFGLAPPEAETLLGTAGATAPTPAGAAVSGVAAPAAPPLAAETEEPTAPVILAAPVADEPSAPVATVPGALPLEPPPPRPEDPEHPYSGRLDFRGLPILVETAAGETRSGTDPDGHAWSVTMPWHYGEIEGTVGLDGDAIDVMVGPDLQAADVYVLHLRVPGAEAADEDKAYLGFASEEEALAAFRAAYSRADILSGITRWDFDAFKAAALDPAKQGLRLDAPPGSGLPERAPDPAAMDAEDVTDEASES